MRPDIERDMVAALEDMNASRIARLLGIPRPTVRDWPKPHVEPLELRLDRASPQRGHPGLVHRAEVVTPR
jgi:hypothetical protein